jgi:hypothetical protein
VRKDLIGMMMTMMKMSKLLSILFSEEEGPSDSGIIREVVAADMRQIEKQTTDGSAL